MRFPSWGYIIIIAIAAIVWSINNSATKKIDKNSQEAEQIFEKAREFGSAGEYEKAIELFMEAHLLSPKWPYPVYDLAYTYLLMKNYEKAHEFYGKTVELAPQGFFTAITAFDALEKEEIGELPVGTYAEFVSYESLTDPNLKKNAIIDLLRRVPEFAPAWSIYSSYCEDQDERLAAIEEGLTANPDRETKGTLLLNKAYILRDKGDNKQATKILNELLDDPLTTFSIVRFAEIAEMQIKAIE